MSDSASGIPSHNAKRYAHRKYALSIFETVYFLILLYAVAASGISQGLVQRLYAGTGMRIFIMPLYLAILLIAYFIVNFPFNFYGSFILEHSFALSKQGFGQWLLDEMKSGLVAFCIGLVLIGAFLYTAAHFPATWWMLAGFFWIAFSLILAKLAPVVIIPLFFKYKKLTDEVLRRRILALGEKMKVRVMDVFEIDFSKKTVKANAAFTGFGATKRVILADTLKEKYSYDEIEVILAHEFAHYKLKHIFKLIVVNSLATMGSFYVIYRTSGRVLAAFGLSSPADLASLPVIFLYFAVFGIVMQPFQAWLSRIMERNADKMALETTGAADAFISMMEKLSSQNLSDRHPHPVIKFFFFDHPPTDERIAMARRSQGG